MGNWHMSIEGVGCHHNNIEEDADKLFKEFVEKVKNFGQNVTHASFTHGGAEVIKPK
jgi:hypothetical protein